MLSSAPNFAFGRALGNTPTYRVRAAKNCAANKGDRYILTSVPMKQSTTATLINELNAPLVQFLNRRVHNNEDANDLAQEAFLRMVKFERSATLTNARAFLFRTASNLAIDQLRRRKVHDRYVHAETAPTYADDDKCEPSPERTVCAKQELELISAAIASLRPRARRAFLLHRNHDLSYAQIASEMAVSASMVEKYITEALKMLRAQIP
jgi:RNA polymerase sigma factor (sigma-70 family)